MAVRALCDPDDLGGLVLVEVRVGRSLKVASDGLVVSWDVVRLLCACSKVAHCRLLLINAVSWVSVNGCYKRCECGWKKDNLQSGY